MARHKLERTTPHTTYSGGRYRYRHFIGAGDDIDTTWHYVGDVFAYSLDEAQRLVRAECETSREWTD